MITTTREVFISVGQAFNKKLIASLLQFDNEELSISESLVKTKNNFSDRQKFFIYYFGDPVKKLAIPKPNVKITKMNGVEITQSLDTLKALSKVRFEGVVTDNLENTLSDFNGNLSTTVFDIRGLASVENGNFNFEFIVPRDVRVAYGNGKLSFYVSNNELDKDYL